MTTISTFALVVGVPIRWGTCLEQRPAEKASSSRLTCGFASTALHLPMRFDRSGSHARAATTHNGQAAANPTPHHCEAPPAPRPASETPRRRAGSPRPDTTRAAREPRPRQDQAATRSPPASPDPAENPGQEQACPAEESRRPKPPSVDTKGDRTSCPGWCGLAGENMRAGNATPASHFGPVRLNSVGAGLARCAQLRPRPEPPRPPSPRSVRRPVA